MTIKQLPVNSIKVGNYIIIDDVACRVVDIQISRPGKHGHSKIRLSAIGLIDNKKRELILPGHDKINVPVIEKRTAQVLSVHQDTATVMDTESYETFDLAIPEELKGRVVEGGNILYWVILDEKVMKAVR